MIARTLIAALALVCAGHAHAAAEPLAPGVLIDADAGRAIVADAAGYAQSVSLADGSTTWISGEQAFPLLELPGRLLALGRIDAKGVGLLLLLDPATGALRDRIAFDVPESIAATVMPRPKSAFTVTAQATAQGARVHWRDVAAPLRGAYYGDGSDEPRVTEGAFDLVLDAARSLAIPLRETPAAPAAPTPDLVPSDRLPALGERQFRGLGSASAMASAPVADATFGTLWQWTVQARGADAAIVGPSLPYAYLPFAVLEGRLLYRTEPTVWRGADGTQTGHGARLVAWDLARSLESWHVDVLDPVYRGPLPP